MGQYYNDGLLKSQCFFNKKVKNWNNNNGENMYYINLFFVFSVFGYLLETAYSFIMHTNFKSGFLYGPITPLYGIGIIIIFCLSNYIFNKLHLSKVVETIIVFILITLILTFLEFVAGFLIEKIFHVAFWDYSNQKFHIGKYISLSMSLIWGVGSIFLIYYVKPWISDYINKIPNGVTILFIVLFITDIIITMYNKLKFS